jgi:kynureninase
LRGIPTILLTTTKVHLSGRPMLDFTQTRELFELPSDIIYLDGNSLGPLPKHTASAVDRVLKDEWGKQLITAWNKSGWFTQPDRVGNRIAKLIGAEQNSVTVGDTLSIKVFQAVAAGLAMSPHRKIILSDSGNFPTDLYIADGLAVLLDRGHAIKTVEPEQVEASLTADIAVLLLTEVDYRTGRRHNMAEITKKAQQLGIITIWDLAHSAGAFPVELAACNVDFAVGCTYKYLNGGPGAPAFIYVAPRVVGTVQPVLSGWMGHDAPFAFSRDYVAAQNTTRMRVGTPPVIAMAVLEAALDIWEQVDLAEIRKESVRLSEFFIAEVDRRCPTLGLATPRDATMRGSHVSFTHQEGYAIMQAMIARGVIGDFRAPTILRFGICPLYNTESEILRAAEALETVMKTGAWQKPEFMKKHAVT